MVVPKNRSCILRMTLVNFALLMTLLAVSMIQAATVRFHCILASLSKCISSKTSCRCSLLKCIYFSVKTFRFCFSCRIARDAQQDEGAENPFWWCDPNQVVTFLDTFFLILFEGAPFWDTSFGTLLWTIFWRKILRL